jgi:hypothetical protein
MHRKCKLALAVAIALAGPGWASAQSVAPVAGAPAQTAAVKPPGSAQRVEFGAPVAVMGSTSSQVPVQTTGGPAPPGEQGPAGELAPGGDPAETRARSTLAAEGRPEEEQPLGPTPFLKSGILQNFLFGDDADKAKYRVGGWLDADYSYRSTGPGRNNVAPVQNRFGDEFLMREIGLLISRPLDTKTWSWGFNIIFFGGSDASFISPTLGGWANPNPRFGSQFTDLNATAHLPILTDGGVDLKFGRQTTALGPMGALSWQRPLNSSDYAWYNLEEGRYTGISADWVISKQLSWYNGLELGGWGTFFDFSTGQVDYITKVNYWLDSDAKTTKVWGTVLTGPTGHFDRSGNTTTLEAGILHNWNKWVYTILDTQDTYSKAPIFFNPPRGYQQRAYDVYMYTGFHLNPVWDITTRLEWYRDQDGGGYPGGFGVPRTDYYEGTIGLNFHPTKWAEFRPEIRYDHATHPNFGALNNMQNQLSISADLLLKF